MFMPDLKESAELVLKSYNITAADLAAILESDAFGHVVEGHLAKQADAAANGRAGSVVRTVQSVDACVLPLKDEDGEYLPYRCVVCATKAKIRRQKRGTGGKKAAAAEQLSLEQGAG